jgi:hypothetical protein
MESGITVEELFTVHIFHCGLLIITVHLLYYLLLKLRNQPPVKKYRMDYFVQQHHAKLFSLPK